MSEVLTSVRIEIRESGLDGMRFEFLVFSGDEDLVGHGHTTWGATAVGRATGQATDILLTGTRPAPAPAPTPQGAEGGDHG